MLARLQIIGFVYLKIMYGIKTMNIRNKETWYYPRGLKNTKWRKRYFHRYGRWLWDIKLLEIDIEANDLILHKLKTSMLSLLTTLQNKFN